MDPSDGINPLFRIPIITLLKTRAQGGQMQEELLRVVCRNAAKMLERDRAIDNLSDRSRTDVVPGVMRCAKCKFVLHRQTLFMRSGTVGAGTNETEPCPNGCGPLWPQTWRDEARDLGERLEALWEEHHDSLILPPAGANGEVETMMEAYEEADLSTGTLHPTVWWAMRKRLVDFYRRPETSEASS